VRRLAHRPPLRIANKSRGETKCFPPVRPGASSFEKGVNYLFNWALWLRSYPDIDNANAMAPERIDRAEGVLASENRFEASKPLT